MNGDLETISVFAGFAILIASFFLVGHFDEPALIVPGIAPLAFMLIWFKC